MITWTPTDNGRRGEFVDTYGRVCIIEISGAPLCLWIGLARDPMHINQTMAREWIGVLERFVKTGEV